MATTFTNLLYHIVFSTKERRPSITSNLRDELYSYIGGILRGERCVLLEIGGTADHIHLLAKFRADMAVSRVVQLVKGKSSKWANRRRDLGHWMRWQTGYGGFTVSQSQIPKLRAYIQNQEEHHRKVTFQEEFVALLEMHGIEYDERYLWD